MNTKHIALAFFITASIVPLSFAAQRITADTAKATMKNSAGETIGTITLEQTSNGVLLTGALTGIPEGAHAFHIHETGNCDAATGFKSAGGHFAEGKPHGFRSDGGPHPGDMSNFYADKDNALTIEAFNPRVSIKGSSLPDLLDNDGSALVIHTGEDDYKSQPSGDAGDRIACGVIETM